MTPPTPTDQSPAGAHTMQCLEVWGGNRAVDNGVVMPGLDAWVYSRPYRGQAAGGDIHYVSSCASGRITRVLVADVSGHGDDVARVAAALRDLMRRYVNYIDMGRLARELNREFTAASREGLFATALIATCWAPTGDLTLVNAGHPRPLWYRARRRSWSFLEQSEANRAEGLVNIPLGVADPARYEQVGMRLGRGDLVVLYTDALIESPGADGRRIGADGLLAIASRLDPADPRRFINDLLERVRAAGAEPVHDDVTVLVLRPNDLKPRVSIIEGLRTTGRLVRALGASVLPGGERFPWPQRGWTNVLGAFFRRFNGRPRSGPGPG